MQLIKELDGFCIPFEFNGEHKYFKYNLNARLYLESMTDFESLIKKPHTEWTFDDILHYTRAMLLDSYYDENKELIEKREFSKCKPYLSELGRYLDQNGMNSLVMKILEGETAALPIAPVGAENTNPHQAV